ncbi:MAG TPA: hypothetical protein VH475_14005 [Tepidisphaeraceae bacterium]|jgi:HEPN domain-containing protein
MTQAELLEQRALDAVSRCLLRQLTVPKIYFDPEWPDSNRRVDILAVDRAGSGDVHVVEVKRYASTAVDYAKMMSAEIAGTYKWIAVFSDSLSPELEGPLRDALQPETGMGRIGLIKIFPMTGGELGANVVVKAERFPATPRDLIAHWMASNQPDIEFGGPEEPLNESPTNPLFDEGEIERRLNEIKELEARGHAEAALLFSWSVAEALMRLAIARVGEDPGREPPTRLVRLLKSHGILSAGEEAALLSVSAVRNQIAHGFKSSSDLKNGVDQMVSLISKLRERLAGQPT